jgi:hypothetical protein
VWHRSVAAAQAIRPPPRLVIATIEGRGGMPGWKSGQRVAGFSKVAGCAFGSSSSASPGCWMATKKVVSSGVNSGPQSSAPFGQRKNSFDVPRAGPSVSSGPDAVGPAGFAGELPSVAIHSRPWRRRAIVGHAEPAVLAVVAGLKVAPDGCDGRIAAAHQDLPAIGRGGVVAPVRRHLHDVAEAVVGARIGGSTSSAVRRLLLVSIT